MADLFTFQESTPLENLLSAKNAWIKDGVVVVRGDANPFQLERILRLSDLAIADFTENRTGVDWHAHPKHHSLYFLKDEVGKQPEIQSGRSAEIVELCNDPSVLAAVKSLTGIDELHWRAIRFHRMSPGGHFVTHKDTDENPDYKVSIVIGLNDPLGNAYQGGHTVTLGTLDDQTHERPTLCRRQLILGDAYIMQSGAQHFVEPVISGYKDSLILFASDKRDENRKISFRAATLFHELYGGGK